MKKLLIAGLTGLTILATSSLALAGSKIAISYAPDNNETYDIITLSGAGKDSATHVKFFNVDASYSFSKDLSVAAFFKKGDIENIDNKKVGERSVLGSELTYNLSKEITLGGFFDYRTDTDEATGTDKADRLRYGLRGKYASGKYTVTSYIRNTTLEYDDAYVAKQTETWKSQKEVKNALESPIKFEIEGNYNLVNSKEAGKIDALLAYSYENAEKDDNQRKTAGLSLGVKGSYQLGKLATTYRAAYSPLTYTYKDAGKDAKEYDKNEFKVNLGAEYPISDRYFVKGTYELIRAEFEKDANDKYSYSEDNIYLGAGLKF